MGGVALDLEGQGRQVEQAPVGPQDGGASLAFRPGDLGDVPPPGETGSSAPALRPAPSDPLSGADVRGASKEHLEAMTRLIRDRESVQGSRRAGVLWVRSTATHVVWAERRAPQREVICVAQIDSGKVVARWQFG